MKRDVVDARRDYNAVMDHREVANILDREFSDIDDCRRLLADYFSTSGNRYTGSQFESLCDLHRPNEITERDILAVGALSVDVPVRASMWILGDEGRSSISDLLAATDPEVEMWHPRAEPLLSEGGPLWRLWDLLSTAHWPSPSAANGLGRTTISKLIATKRPRLSPVLDSVITKKVFPGVDRFWESFRLALSEQDLRDRLLGATDSPLVPPNVVLLRRIDVVLWMRHHG